jgi:hypothetical protein
MKKFKNKNFSLMNLKQFWKDSIVNINRVSFLLLILPYIGIHIVDFKKSPFIDVITSLILLLTIISIDILFKLLVSISSKFQKILSIVLLSTTILFFYGFTFVNPIHQLLDNKLNIIVREKIIFLLLSIILIIIQILIIKNKSDFKIFNSFLIILSIMTFSNSFIYKSDNKIYINSTKNNYYYLDLNKKYTKPVILIILDEYNSPDDLFKLTNDKNLYDLNDYLKNNGWETNTNSYSYNPSTVHSLGSIFNFNLSKNKNYADEDMEKTVTTKLRRSLLSDSLESKNVDIFNYGIFDFGEYEYFSRLYLYPRNTIEEFLLYTSYMSEKAKTGDFQFKYIKNPPLYIQDHNRFILNELPEILNKKNINKNTFLYVHLYMPHNPFNLEPEFYNTETDNFKRYLAFWKFTNRKLQQFLIKLNRENRYRVIMTGDHGFRTPNTNANRTFTAYYGFEKDISNKIESVQDLGILINQSY